MRIKRFPSGRVIPYNIVAEVMEACVSSTRKVRTLPTIVNPTMSTLGVVEVVAVAALG